MTWDSTPIDWLPNANVAEIFWLACSIPSVIMTLVVLFIAFREVRYHYRQREQISFGIAIGVATELIFLLWIASMGAFVGVVTALAPQPARVDQQERADLLVMAMLSINLMVPLICVTKCVVLYYIHHWNQRLHEQNEALEEHHEDHHEYEQSGETGEIDAG